jgi:uncharacterized membrane protein
MEYKKIFSLDDIWKANWKTVTLFSFLAIMPNLLGMINIPTAWGFKIHLFQYLIFVAAAVYGPIGGLVSGGFGSIVSAIMMGNPYILIGNMILGFATGLLFRKGFGLVISAMAAFAIQMPFLYFTDVYLIGMPTVAVYGIIAALLVSDLLWAIGARYTYKHIKNLTE